MSARLIDALLRRSPRERLLLALLVGVGIPLLVIVGLMLPLAERRAAAAVAYEDAVAERVWMADRVAEVMALGQPVAANETGPRPAIGISGLEQSLIDAGLRDAVTSLANGTDGSIELGFDVVVFTLLMDWMSAQAPIWGYDLAALRLLRDVDRSGFVASEIRLRPQEGE